MVHWKREAGVLLFHLVVFLKPKRSVSEALSPTAWSSSLQLFSEELSTIVLSTDLSYTLDAQFWFTEAKLSIHCLFFICFGLFCFFFSRVPGNSSYHIMNKIYKSCTVPHNIPPEWLQSDWRRTAWHEVEVHLSFHTKSAKFMISWYCQSTSDNDWLSCMILI